MSEKIEVDFEKLDQYIIELKKLMSDMDEPSKKKTRFWAGDATGSGLLLDCLDRFCDDTIEFHNQVYKLIKNTVKYLERIKKLQEVDSKIADQL